MTDVEIGAIGQTKCYMKLDELFRIANKEVQEFADSVCRDNSKLQYQLEVATEALKFYAEEKHILSGCRDYSDYDNAVWVEGDVENGMKAREVLKEIEDG